MEFGRDLCPSNSASPAVALRIVVDVLNEIVRLAVSSSMYSSSTPSV